MRIGSDVNPPPTLAKGLHYMHSLNWGMEEKAKTCTTRMELFVFARVFGLKTARASHITTGRCFANISA